MARKPRAHFPWYFIMYLVGKNAGGPQKQNKEIKKSEAISHGFQMQILNLDLETKTISKGNFPLDRS
jgi:hypothetical protein